MTSHTITANDGSKARFDIFSTKNGGHVQIVYLNRDGHNYYTENQSIEQARKTWVKLKTTGGF